MKRSAQDAFSTDFDRISQAIRFIEQHAKQQPSLDEIAQHLGLSPFHFQKLFQDWAGISPKQFLQAINLTRAKELLRKDKETLLQTSIKTGLSSPSRLHDLFIRIEGMTPNEYKNGGRGLSIRYEICPTPFGCVLIASTSKGICQLLYVVNDEQNAIDRLQATFANADIQPGTHPMHERALAIFGRDWNNLTDIKLHLKGTDFQLNVWRALLTIPSGKLTTYKNIATQAGNPNACRAAGTAIGDNPVAFLIPCHRIIQSSGAFGNYHWGSERKIAMIGWEGTKDDSATE